MTTKSTTTVTFDTISIGDEVLFGRSKGERTKGEIVKKNGKSAKVKQLESRGTQKSHPVGTVWTVPYTLLSRTTPAPAKPAPYALEPEQMSNITGMTVEAMGKTFKVRAICTSVDQANAFCEAHSGVGVLSNNHNDTVILVCNDRPL